MGRSDKIKHNDTNKLDLFKEPNLNSKVSFT